MSKHTNDKLGIVFHTPDQLTIREQLEFMSVVHSSDDEREKYALQWKASLPLIRGWKCDWLPDPEKLDLKMATNGAEHFSAILWASSIVFTVVMGLDRLPKDSSVNASSAPNGEQTPPLS